MLDLPSSKVPKTFICFVLLDFVFHILMIVKCKFLMVVLVMHNSPGRPYKLFDVQF